MKRKEVKLTKVNKFSDKNIFVIFLLAVFMFGFSFGIYFSLPDNAYLITFGIAMGLFGFMIYAMYFQTEDKTEEKPE